MWREGGGNFVSLFLGCGCAGGWVLTGGNRKGVEMRGGKAGEKADMICVSF